MTTILLSIPYYNGTMLTKDYYNDFFEWNNLNPPVELGRLANASDGERSIPINTPIVQ